MSSNTIHITPVANGFIVDQNGDEEKTVVFQRDNSDEMFEFLAHLLEVHALIYPPLEGDSSTQLPMPFSVPSDPDI